MQTTADAKHNVSCPSSDRLRPLWPTTTHGRWIEEEGTDDLVSVIVPAYNRADLIIDALDSVADQTYRPIELLVVDDGSTDDTAAVVRDWTDHVEDTGFEVHLIQQSNQGAPAARNHGALRSQGEFIQFLDSDDKIHPKKIQSQVNLLREHPNVGFVYCLGTYFGGEEPGERLSGFNFHEEGIPAMLQRNMYQTSAALYRRSVCRLAGPWDEELGGAQEWEYAFRALVAADRQILFQSDVYNYLRTTRTYERITEPGLGYLEERMEALKKVKNTLQYADMLEERPVAQSLATSFVRKSFLLHDQGAPSRLVRACLSEAAEVAPLELQPFVSLLYGIHRGTKIGYGVIKRLVRALSTVRRVW